MKNETNNASNEFELFAWLAIQKLSRIEGKLSKADIRKLEALGVDWALTTEEAGYLRVLVGDHLELNLMKNAEVKALLIKLAKAGAPRPDTKKFTNWLDAHPEYQIEVQALGLGEMKLQTYKVNVIELDAQGLDALRQDHYDSPWDIEAINGLAAIAEAKKGLQKLACDNRWDIEHDYQFVARIGDDDYDVETDVWHNAPVVFENSQD